MIKMTVSLSPPLRDVLPLRDGLRSELPRLADDLARDIRRRTEGGRGVAGRRLRRKKDGTASTLQDSGKMVESFRPQTVTDRGFVLAPTGRRNRQIAAIHQNTGRPWIGVTDAAVERARERIAEATLPKDR